MESDKQMFPVNDVDKFRRFGRGTHLRKLWTVYFFGVEDLLGFNPGVFPGVLLLSRRR
jgi:hypothetical protein